MWKRKQSKTEPDWRDHVAGVTGKMIIRWQTSISQRLGKWQQRFTNFQKAVLLLLFCLLGAGYCIYLLYLAVFTSTAATQIPNKEVPEYSLPPPGGSPHTDSSKQILPK